MLYLIGLLLAVIASIAIVTLFFLRRKFRELHARLNRLESHAWETAMISTLIAGQPTLPRPGWWAASTDILYELARIIETERPRLIVELGSGLSTVVLAAAAARNGSRVVSGRNFKRL